MNEIKISVAFGWLKNVHVKAINSSCLFMHVIWDSVCDQFVLYYNNMH